MRFIRYHTFFNPLSPCLWSCLTVSLCPCLFCSLCSALLCSALFWSTLHLLYDTLLCSVLLCSDLPLFMQSADHFTATACSTSEYHTSLSMPKTKVPRKASIRSLYDSLTTLTCSGWTDRCLTSRFHLTWYSLSCSLLCPPNLPLGRCHCR